MHFCTEELTAIMFAFPVVGWLFHRVRVWVRARRSPTEKEQTDG